MMMKSSGSSACICDPSAGTVVFFRTPTLPPMSPAPPVASDPTTPAPCSSFHRVSSPPQQPVPPALALELSSRDTSEHTQVGLLPILPHRPKPHSHEDGAARLASAAPRHRRSPALTSAAPRRQRENSSRPRSPEGVRRDSLQPLPRDGMRRRGGQGEDRRRS